MLSNRLCCPMEVNLSEDFRRSWPFNLPSKVHSAAGHLEVMWPQSFVYMGFTCLADILVTSVRFLAKE